MGFNHVNFNHEVSFKQAIFGRYFTDFTSTKFIEKATFEESYFSSGASFICSRFEKEVTFYKAYFHDHLDFRFCVFKNYVPNFIGIAHKGTIFFSCKENFWPKHRSHITKEGFYIDDTDISMKNYVFLRSLMKKNEMIEEELFFHAKELEVKTISLQKSKKLEDRNCFYIYCAYGFFSHYGQSISAPLLKLGVFGFCVFALIYWCIIIGYSDFPASSLPPFKIATYLAFHHFVSFLPTDEALHGQLFNLKILCDGATSVAELALPLKATGCGLWFSFTNAIQKILSLLCWFLVALGLRNHLRMR